MVATTTGLEKLIFMAGFSHASLAVTPVPSCFNRVATRPTWCEATRTRSRQTTGVVTWRPSAVLIGTRQRSLPSRVSRPMSASAVKLMTCFTPATVAMNGAA